MEIFFKKFEGVISVTLLVIGMLFTAYQTLDLIWLFGRKMVKAIVDQQFYMAEEGTPSAALFFGILLTLEIMQTVRVSSKGHREKAKIIMLVGLIAVTRKIFVLDLEHHDPVAEFAIAALIVAFSFGYFLFRYAKVERSTAST